MNQIDFTFDLACGDARAEGERQADLCATKAEKTTEFDREKARECILRHLQAVGSMAGEDLTDIAKAHGFRPHDDRAFGAVFSALSRRGLIRAVGSCARRRGHGTAGGRIWAICR